MPHRRDSKLMGYPLLRDRTAYFRRSRTLITPHDTMAGEQHAYLGRYQIAFTLEFKRCMQTVSPGVVGQSSLAGENSLRPRRSGVPMAY